MSIETVKNLAKKWYKKIGFSSEYDEEFESLLKEFSDVEEMPYEDYDLEANKENNQKNLLMYLYFCEELSEKYKAKGIPEEILMASITPDFQIMVKRCIILTGQIGLIGIKWFNFHMKMQLFRLGRLQFCMFGCYEDIPSKGIKKGDPVMDIHIPGGIPLAMEECEKSFEMCEEFFGKYFPEYSWDYYTCYSWLLDDVLKKFLNEDANIIKFQNLFEPACHMIADSALNFMFKYGLKSRDEIKDIPAKSDFAKKLKEYALAGGELKNVLGVKRR